MDAGRRRDRAEAYEAPASSTKRAVPELGRSPQSADLLDLTPVNVEERTPTDWIGIPLRGVSLSRTREEVRSGGGGWRSR